MTLTAPTPRSSSTRPRTSPRRRRASRTGASSRSTCASATRASATTSSSTRPSSTTRLRTAEDLPTTSQPTPRRLPRRLRGALAATSGSTRSTSPRSSPARSQSASLAADELGGDRVRVDRLASRRRPRSRCSGSRSSGGSSAARPTRRSTRSLERLPARRRAALHRRHARVPRQGRSDRPRPGPGRHAPQRQADPRDRDGEVMPVKRVRGNAEGARRTFVEEFSDATTRRAGAPGRRSRTRTRRSGPRSCGRWSRSERPHAEIELVTTLGAVVGTHAGPGTVGFFWFQTDRRTSARRRGDRRTGSLLGR